MNLDRRHQAGQALVWFLAVIAASLAVLYGVYSVAQATTAKQKLVNATDAGALAGAAEQARLLNFMAYGNRAMIASDVMLAQMVSLDSWLRWLRQSSLNIQSAARVIPYIQAVSVLFNGVYQIVNPIELAFSKALEGLLMGLDAFKVQAQLANDIAYQTGGALAMSAAQSVLEANSLTSGPRIKGAFSNLSIPQLGGDIGLNEVLWRDFTQVHAGQKRERLAQVVSHSRDEFSVRRDGNHLTNWNIGLARSRKRGTTLLRNYERWEAQDTWEVRIPRPFRSAMTLPIGWGRADAGDDGHLMIGNEGIHDLAFLSRKDYQWSGISSIRDLSSSQSDHQLYFYQVAAISSREVLNAGGDGSSIGSAQADASVLGSSNLGLGFLAGQMTSISAATVYFERPQGGVNDWTAQAWAGGRELIRQDQLKEYASLYNPFWQVRLTSVPQHEKAALLIALGAPQLALSDALR